MTKLAGMGDNRTWADEQAEELSVKFPKWQVWYVPLFVGGHAWCARLHDNHKMVLNANSPDELAQMISQHEATDAGTMSQPIRKEEASGPANQTHRE